MMHAKKDFQDCLKDIIKPLENRFVSGKAGIKCGVTSATYDDKTAEIEAFARPLWGLAPLWCGNGECGSFDKIYLEGIINGTNPNHPSYWGKIEDCDQKIVETAAIGLALILAPHKLWEPLNEEEKTNFYNWLSQVNKVKNIDNNWRFFPILVNLGFKTVGMPYDKELIKYSINRVDSFYKGNGWYSDGNSNQMDYYISFAIHFYSLIYAKVMEIDDAETSNKFKHRAEQFAKDFIYWFDETGAALAFGRSQTYRFAQCCFWSACIFAGIKPFPIGVIKGIISRHLQHWLSLPIFDNGNILSIGYGYPNIGMAEEYNAPGSPYWALKTFLILALDDDDEFFKAEALPLPALDKLRIITEANMVIQRVNGYVVALTAGQWADFRPLHTSEKYSKFAYSSKFAFNIPKSYLQLKNAGTDSMLVFVDDDRCFVRGKCESYSIDKNGDILSEWSPVDGVGVKSTITPTVDGHIRSHIINCDKSYTVYDCGFATPYDSGDILGDGEKVTINCTPNTNLMHTKTSIKAIKYEIKKGVNEIKTMVIYPQ